MKYNLDSLSGQPKSEEDLYQPIACSNPKYSFHDSEMQIIDRLRAWSKEYFEKNLIFDHEVSIPTQVYTSVAQP